MKYLGNLLLPQSIQWIDQWDWSPVSQSTDRTLGGQLVFWSHQLAGGRPITLVAEDGVTWLTKEQVVAISEMASVAGATYSLDWDGEQFSVIFTHHDEPAISFRPIMPHHSKFTGTIKLITV